jgi:hypothetical protein
MASKSLPPKTTQQKRPAAPQSSHHAPNNADPGFAALRLQGLSRLIYFAASSSLDQNPIDESAAFFISSELREIAEGLLARGTAPRRGGRP